MDGGKRENDEIAPLVARLPIPDEWRFVLAVRRQRQGFSGVQEQKAFQELSRHFEPEDLERRSENLSRLLLLGVLPAVKAGEFPAFAESLLEYGHKSGEFFRHVQGGAYASDWIEQVVDFLRAEGAASGQSSWGPTTFAVVPYEERAHQLAEALRQRFDLSPEETVVTRARNCGANIEL